MKKTIRLLLLIAFFGIPTSSIFSQEPNEIIYVFNDYSFVVLQGDPTQNFLETEDLMKKIPHYFRIYNKNCQTILVVYSQCDASGLEKYYAKNIIFTGSRAKNKELLDAYLENLEYGENLCFE